MYVSNIDWSKVICAYKAFAIDTIQMDVTRSYEVLSLLATLAWAN